MERIYSLEIAQSKILYKSGRNSPRQPGTSQRLDLSESTRRYSRQRAVQITISTRRNILGKRDAVSEVTPEVIL